MIPFRRLLAFAVSELGWSEAQFWAASTCTFHAVLELRDGAFGREDYAAFKREVEDGAMGR